MPVPSATATSSRFHGVGVAWMTLTTSFGFSVVGGRFESIERGDASAAGFTVHTFDLRAQLKIRRSVLRTCSTDADAAPSRSISRRRASMS